ncbi:MAG TPA: DUF3667 domain-containing protein [Anaeromyxobacteraceae bacterium]|nr:DUF3667 domain-containing protein [Anaeromyxobacteraceae bacterium]
MTGPAAAPCANCGVEAPGRYCPECGQSTRWTARQPAWRIAAEAVEETFALDSRIGRTGLPFLFRPGFLTAEYWAGRRARYSSPLRLYLLLSFLFFLAGAPLRSARLAGSPEARPTAEEEAEIGRGAAELRRAGSMGAALAERVERIRSLPREESERRFSAAFAENAPRVAIVLVPLLALYCRILWRRRYFAEHLVFALHAQALGFAALIPGTVSGSAAATSAGGLGAAVWTFLAVRRLHGERGLRGTVKFILLGVLYLATLGAVVAAVALLAVLAL